MRRAHQTAETQYGFGGSAAGRGVIDRGGYGLVARVPVCRRVLRPGYRLRDPSLSWPGKLLRAAKDTAGVLARPRRAPAATVEWGPVAAFGAELGPVLAAYEARAVFSSRGSDFLNYVVRYPRGGLGGGLLRSGGVVRGLALLATVGREGRIAECLLDDPDDADLWHAAVLSLTAELGRRGADLAVAFASTPWASRALRAAGYAPVHALEFRLRDRAKKLPSNVPFHLTPLEADYAYT
jgi:hypothetical protein